jgi:pantoate--beta-alanine ligase
VKIVHRIAEVREARSSFAQLGLVPTMGYLHAGHLSLVTRARAECGAAAVSIFLNPTQFGPGEDLARYPRNIPRDLALLGRSGVDLVFVPEISEIYPQGFSTRIDPGGIGAVLDGASRPGHFAGVATVVAKLLNIFQPDRAYFGQKDGQQCAVIRHLVRDLDMNVRIVVGETIREADGLAMSSRNVYLDPPQRHAAAVLYRSLQAAKRCFDEGERHADRLREGVRAIIADEPLAALDYVSVAEPDTLEELPRAVSGSMVSVAARFGPTRLIDNVIL